MQQLGALLLLLLLGGPLWASDANERFELSTHCPPALRLDESGRCRLYSQYLNYGSLYDRGVGGLRTGLPAVRDGFTPAQIDLGRYLFFDPLLSGKSDIACSSCHDPALGFSDGLAQSIGATGEPIKRSAPSLWNVAFLEKLLWDGSKRSLEEQMLGPLYADDEMAGSQNHSSKNFQKTITTRHYLPRPMAERKVTVTSPSIAFIRHWLPLKAP